MASSSQEQKEGEGDARRGEKGELQKEDESPTGRGGQAFWNVLLGY